MAPAIASGGILMPIKQLIMPEASPVLPSGFRVGDTILMRCVPEITVHNYRIGDTINYPMRAAPTTKTETWSLAHEARFKVDREFRLSIASMPRVRLMGMRTWQSSPHQKRLASVNFKDSLITYPAEAA